MPESISRALLWLLVINLGIALGAGLFESRIVVPRWISSSPDLVRHWNAEAARQDDTGRRFWAFVTTLPLTLLTLANLIAAWRTPAPMRGWWLTAAIAAVADRVVTFAYFIPTMVRLMRASDSPESVAVAIRWAHLNYARLAILLAAWVTALKALSLSYPGPVQGVGS